MTYSWIPAISAIFSGTWDLLVLTRFPGTDIPIAVIMMGAFLIVLGLRLLSFMLGVSGGGSNYRSGRGGKAHGVSDKRKGDEK